MAASATRAALAAALLCALMLPSAARGRLAVHPGASAPSYRFLESAQGRGVEGTSRTWGSAWADFNDDGRVDFLLGRHHRIPRLYVGGLGSFTYRQDTNIERLPMDRHNCAWGEANGDGKPDLFCAQGAFKGTGARPKQLFIQRSDGFVDRAKEFGLRARLTRGRVANWIDYDLDGDLDLFMGNMHRKGYPNAMFRNTNHGFKRTRVGLGQEVETISSSWTDWDRDGDFDLLLMQRRGGHTIAYENRRRRFERVRMDNVSGRPWLSAAWGDFNADGWPDLLGISKTRWVVLRNDRGEMKVDQHGPLAEGRMGVWIDVDNDSDLDAFIVQGAEGKFPDDGSVNHRELLLKRGPHNFLVKKDDSYRGPRSGNGDAVAAADVDRDGAVDLFVTNGLFHFHGSNQLMQNRVTQGNWIGIDLDGGRKNPLAIGARLIVRTAHGRSERLLTDGVTFHAQSEVGFAIIGIGRADAARVRVEWPRGRSDCLRIESGVIKDVRKGSRSCRN